MYKLRSTKTVYEWLNEYGESHQSIVNELIHWVCVPLIIFSILSLIWIIPTPNYFDNSFILINWCVLFVVASSFYYLLLSLKLSLTIIPFAFFLIYIIYLLDKFNLPLLEISIVIFIIAWAGQFIGHILEGKRPSFIQDIQFLMIGPIWLIASLYRRLNIKF
tara:strand:- start:5285 stop:5770 length:486 start_codon:yes stop_codon:yes gene_type:complete